MTKQEAIEVLKSECYVFNPLNFDRTTLINTALDVAIESLKQPYDQVKWERDMAISQLKELGYSLGEKEKTCEGCQYEWNSYNEEECRYCNRFGSDRYRQKEEDEEDEEDEDDEC